MRVGEKSSKGRRKYRSSKTVVWGVLAWIAACHFIGAFFRHFQMRKVNIKISRTKPKIERLLRLFCFFFPWNQLHFYSIPLVSPAIAVYKQCVFGFSSNSLSTPYIFWTLNCSQNIVKSKHEIRGIHFNFCTVSLLIHEFNMNRLHILSSTNWRGDISRNFLISIHFFAVVALASIGILPLNSLIAGSNVPYKELVYNDAMIWLFTSVVAVDCTPENKKKTSN